MSDQDCCIKEELDPGYIFKKFVRVLQVYLMNIRRKKKESDFQDKS